MKLSDLRRANGLHLSRISLQAQLKGLERAYAEDNAPINVFISNDLYGIGDQVADLPACHGRYTDRAMFEVVRDCVAGELRRRLALVEAKLAEISVKIDDQPDDAR